MCILLQVSEEHFNNLKNQYSEAVLRVRDLCDQAVDPLDFVRTACKCLYLFKGFLRGFRSTCTCLQEYLYSYFPQLDLISWVLFALGSVFYS